MSEISNYSNQFEQNDFYITENDIGDLDLFFMFKNSDTDYKIVREPIFYFSVASYADTRPVYSLGREGIVSVSKGKEVVTGKIIINAFHNVPLVNLLMATDTPSGNILDLPMLDFFVTSKNNKNKKFQDCVLKNLKFISFNFEQGIETPGRFVILEFIATSFKGVHIRDFFKDKLHGSIENSILSVNSFDPTKISKNFGENGSSSIVDSEYDILYRLIDSNRIYKSIKNETERLLSLEYIGEENVKSLKAQIDTLTITMNNIYNKQNGFLLLINKVTDTNATTLQTIDKLKKNLNSKGLTVSSFEFSDVNNMIEAIELSRSFRLINNLVNNVVYKKEIFDKIINLESLISSLKKGE